MASKFQKGVGRFSEARTAGGRGDCAVQDRCVPPGAHSPASTHFHIGCSLPSGLPEPESRTVLWLMVPTLRFSDKTRQRAASSIGRSCGSRGLRRCFAVFESQLICGMESATPISVVSIRNPVSTTFLAVTWWRSCEALFRTAKSWWSFTLAGFGISRCDLPGFGGEAVCVCL